MKFNTTVEISKIEIQFQGGFSCKEVELVDMNNLDQTPSNLYPDDINNMQTFMLDKPVKLSTLRMNLKKPTDTFGRMIIYHLSFFGTK